MRKLTILLLILTGIAYAGKTTVYNDIVYLRSGEEIPAHVLEIRKGHVKLEKMGVKKPVIIPIDSVSSIDIGKIREGDAWHSIKDINDSILKRVIGENPEMIGNYVNLYLSYNVVLREDSSYSVKVRVIRKILTKSGEWGGNVRFWYPDFAIARVLFARSISPDGKIVHIRDNAIENGTYNFSYPNYAHLREIKLAIPESKVGNILDFSFEIDYPKISDNNPFYFVLPLGEYQPTYEGKVTLKIPANFKINFRQFGVKDPFLLNNGKVKVITWSIKEHHGIKREKYMPPYKTLLPTVAFAQATTWGNLASVLEKKITNLGVPKELSNENDPVSLYLYVQHNLENVDAPLISQKYIFTDGRKIIDNGYANIFDKAILIYNALRKRGKKVKLGLLISKDNPTFPKLPGIGGAFDGYFLSAREPGNGMFDGAFVVVDDSLYLFPGERYVPVGYIPPKFQEAFYLDITNGTIDILPGLPAEGESFIVERKCRVDGNDLLVTEIRKFKGYAEMKERELAKLKPRELKQKKEMELARMWQNAELLSFEHTDFDSINAPLEETLSYRIKDFLLNEGNLVLYRIPSFYTGDSLFSPQRNYDIYMAKPLYYKLTTFITLGKKLSTLYAPKGTMVQDSGYYYTYSIYRKRNGYKIEENLRRAISEIPAKDAPSYLNCISTPVMYSRKWFIMKTKNNK